LVNALDDKIYKLNLTINIMVAKEGYKINPIYQGADSSFTPPQNGYLTAGSLGLATDPRTANQLQEVSSRLSSGVKFVDIAAVSPEIFDSMPKQQLTEINRLSKLTGIDVTMHGPVIDVSGISQQGFSETQRDAAERKVAEVLLRSHELNPKGNVLVTFHSSEGLPGSQLLPPAEREKGKEYQKMFAINRESGRMTDLEREKEFYPGGEVKESVRLPEDRLRILNNTEWKNSLFQIEVNRENAERIMQDIHPTTISRFVALKGKQLDPKQISGQEINQMDKLASADEFVGQANVAANALFSKAYELAEKDKDVGKINFLKKVSKDYGEMVGVEGGVPKNAEKYLNPKLHAQALLKLTQELEVSPPKMWVPLEEFAAEKSSQSFGNAAFEAYKKFKDTTPTLVIENPPASHALSSGEDIKNLVLESRKQFEKKAIAEGISKSEAKKQAEKLIGATWDVGHINMMRKFGYTEEDIVKESEKVKPVLKHIHLSDNFGFEHTELPMGMGNVPLQEIMKKLGKKGFEAKKLIEAGQWWQHFKTPPLQETLEAVGSPVYSMKMAPYWSQAPALYQGYFSGYGQMLPQINYETFGAGFARLPQELGGQVQGAGGGRMSGNPME
jgi:hypothetical protein